MEAGGGSTIVIRPVTVQVKVWRVLGQFDQPDDRGNVGSRLFEEEIQIMVRSLETNAVTLFGPGITLQWDGNIDDITDPYLLFDRQRDAQSFHYEVIHLENHWHATKINVYFAGNTQNDKLSDPIAVGLCADPATVNSDWPLLEGRAFIVINDGGFSLPGGFQQPMWDPSVAVYYHSVEHEMAHFLARFENRTFAGPFGNRTWSNSEHYNNCILHPSAPLALPLTMPGHWNRPASEQGEVWGRLQNNLWGAP